MSKKKSFMRPKRASERYTLTREASQIDARSHLFKTPVAIHPVPCGRDGKTGYRLEINDTTDNICSLRSLSDEFHTAGVPIAISTLEGILDTLLEVVPKYILQTGRSVRIGNLVTLKPFVTGSLTYANDSLDPEKHHLAIQAVASPALRDALANAPLTNTARSSVGIERLNGGHDKHPMRDTIDAVNDILASGTDIYVPCQKARDNDARGSVYVETRDGRRLGGCDVLSSGPNVLQLRFHPDAPIPEEDRECRMVVLTCGTKEAANLPGKPVISRLTYDVTFITSE